MKHIFEPPESVLHHFVRLIKTLSPARNIMIKIVDTTLHYISHAKRNHRPQEIRTIFTTFLAEGKMTTALDLLKEEGIQEGIPQGRDETIIRFLQHSVLSPQEISTISGVDISPVMSLAGMTAGSPPRLPHSLQSRQP
ncbi:MAG: hypothetical protein ACP5OP_04890 [Leptospirillia bacterium]